MDNSAYKLLKSAVAALSNSTSLNLEIVKGKSISERNTAEIPDAVVSLPNTDIELPVDIITNAQHANLGALTHQINRLPGPEPGLLVAKYINPKMAERLKEAGVQFMDTAGNAYINRLPVYILITGKKRLKITDQPAQNPTSRAFEPKGLRVTYAILNDPSLVAQSYREIAAIAGVAVGTVGWVVNALKAGQYLHDDARTGKRRLTNYNKLLERWVSAWPEKFKHHYFLGKFTVKDPLWWKHTNIRLYKGYWGGETAAAIYTKQLVPQVVTIHVPKENLTQLIRDSRLSKANEHAQAEDSLVYLYSPCWNTSSYQGLSESNYQKLNGIAPSNPLIISKTETGLAPPIIVYADLIASADPRNLEAAQRLRDEYITESDRTA